MLSLSVLLFLFVPSVSAGDCSGIFSLESACNTRTLELLQEWPKHRPMPSVKEAISMGYLCMEALDCTKSLECREKEKDIENKVKELGDLCEGIKTFAGPLGVCLQSIRNQQPSGEYPCLKYWDYSRKVPTCKFFTKEYDCAEMYVENQCGPIALKLLRKNLDFISEYFGCTKNDVMTIDPVKDFWPV